MANVKGSNSTNKMTVKPTGNPVTYSVRTDVNNNKIVTNASKETNTFAIKDNMSEYYARLSEGFACGNGIINGVDYSSKYYASLSKEHAETAEEQKNAAIEAMDSFDSDVQAAKADIEQTRLNSIDSVNVLYDSILEGVESVRTNAIESLDQETENNKQEINALADVIKDNADSIINRVGFNMFDTVLKDHVLSYEESKGLALQGTWVYKEAITGERYGYPDFYAKCLEEYNEATATETINGVTVKVHSNGHKFYDIANKSAIDSSFNSLGIAWYYGVDTANECVFLPRSNYVTSYVANGNKTVSVKGNGKTLGLTNGSVNVGMTGTTAQNNNQTFDSRAFNVTPSNTGISSPQQNNGTYGVVTNASQSGLTGTVNITNSQTGMYLYICVGNQVQDNSWVNVIEQVKNGAKEIDDERIKALNDIETDRASAVTSVNTAYNSAMKTLQAVGPVLQTGSTMTGPLIIKTASNPALNYHCGRFDLTTNPDSTVSAGLTISDKAGTRIGMLECQQMANGSKQTSINTMYTKEDGTKAYASIQVGYDVNGNAYTSAPTPAAGDNSTKIATTAFVKQAADGQWVKVTPKVLSSATAVGTYTIDLSSTLKTTGCQHEVLLALRGSQGSDSWTVGRIFVTSSLVAEHSFANVMSTGSDKYQDDEFATGIVPVGTDRKIYMNIRDLGYSTVNLVLFAYRRLGTNK